MKNKKGLLLCSFVFVGGVVFATIFPVRPKTFNAAEWKAVHFYFFRVYGSPTLSGNVERARMVDDLLSHHVKLGMARKKVQALLGPSGVVDGTGDHGPIDIYSLVEKPVGFQWYQVYLWSRYRTKEPRLALEYGGADSHLIATFVY